MSLNKSLSVDDEQDQEDEMLALENIFDPGAFQLHTGEGEIRSGKITIQMEVPKPFHVAIPMVAFDPDTEEVVENKEEGKEEGKKEQGEKKTAGHEHVKFRIESVPPLTLHFTLPKNYPSEVKPNFTLSTTWLHRAAISVLCQKLDQLWEEHKGMGILFTWANYLQVDALSDLGIEDYYHVYWFQKPLHLLQIKKNELTKTRKNYEDDKAEYEKATTCFMNFNPEDTNDLDPPSVEAIGVENAVGDVGKSEPIAGASGSSSKGKGGGGDETENSEGKSSKEKEKSEPVASSSRSSASQEKLKSNQATALKRKSKKETFSIDKRAALEAFPPTRGDYWMDLMGHILDLNNAHIKETFNSSSYYCDICCTQKIGRDCIRFYCDHVFCKECLKAGFTVNIKDGSLDQVKCPAYKCKFKPEADVIKEIVGNEIWERYDEILLKRALEEMNDIVYCPRPKCNAAVLCDPNEKCASCAACGHSFCSICKMVYHGVEPCKFKDKNVKEVFRKYTEGTAEEKKDLIKAFGEKQLKILCENVLSQEWIDKESKNCPHCRAPIEKFEGCNKVTCFRCGTFFCWLCLKQLNKDNPYFHFNDPSSKCFSHLFQGADFDQEPNEWIILDDGDDFEDSDFSDDDDDYDEDEDDTSFSDYNEEEAMIIAAGTMIDNIHSINKIIEETSSSSDDFYEDSVEEEGNGGDNENKNKEKETKTEASGEDAAAAPVAGPSEKK